MNKDSEESKLPNGWTKEEWQKQMYTEVAVAYRIYSLGIASDEDPYTDEDLKIVDKEYKTWRNTHDKETTVKTIREAAEALQKAINSDNAPTSAYEFLQEYANQIENTKE